MEPTAVRGTPEAPNLGHFESLVFDCLNQRLDDVTLAGRLKSLSDADWTQLLVSAREQMVSPMVARRLLTPAVAGALPERVTVKWRSELARVATDNLRLHDDFRRIAGAFHDNRIPFVVLKGLHLASLVYHDAALRVMGDMDLLVRAEDLRRAGVLAQELGYEPLSGYHVSDGCVPFSCKHIPRLMHQFGTPIEVHWHIFNDLMVVVDVSELWSRAVPARVAGIDVLVLAPEDLLLHLCVHATLHHFCEFSARACCDIAETIREYRGLLIWEHLVARATRWRCRRGVYLALRLAHDAVGAEVPAEVLRSLRPPDFDERLLAVAMRQRPGARLPVAIAELATERTLLRKLKTVRRRVFLPKALLADMYGQPRSSPVTLAWYAIRMMDLMRNHWPTVIRLSRGDADCTDAARDMMALKEFFSDEELA